MEPVVVTDTPERTVRIVVAGDDLVVTETRYAVGQRGPRPHVHHLHADCFFVLGGELTLGLEDRDHALGAGAIALVPPDVVHSFRNDGPDELRFFNFHAPGMGFDLYVRGLYDESLAVPFDQHSPPEGGGRDPDLVIVGTGDFVTDRPDLQITLLADADEVGISVSRGAPGGPSPPPHFHRLHTESFGVLEGELVFTVDGSDILVKAGGWMHVPPGTVHTFSFPGTSDARFLNVHTPSCGFGDFLRGLHAARTQEELAAVRARFDQVPPPDGHG